MVTSVSLTGLKADSLIKDCELVNRPKVLDHHEECWTANGASPGYKLVRMEQWPKANRAYHYVHEERLRELVA